MSATEYAIFETGGKQYKVSPGDTIRVEKLDADEEQQVEFDRVLMVKSGEKVAIGNPTVDGAKIAATVLKQGRGKKITVFKYKPKVRYRRKRGHRQSFSEVRVDDIDAADVS